MRKNLLRFWSVHLGPPSNFLGFRLFHFSRLIRKSGIERNTEYKKKNSKMRTNRLRFWSVHLGPTVKFFGIQIRLCSFISASFGNLTAVKGGRNHVYTPKTEKIHSHCGKKFLACCSMPGYRMRRKNEHNESGSQKI